MTHEELRDRLVSEGRELLRAPAKPIGFTKNADANALLNDLDAHPHAFVLAGIVDRQVTAEWAWLVPYRVRERTGSFEMADLWRLDEYDWVRVLREPYPAHRMPETMAKVLYRGVRRIEAKFGGDASAIWSDRPASTKLVQRFLGFYGVGQKISSMMANILAREFRVDLADLRGIDISADVQVIRVMERLRFVEEGASADEVVYAARELWPEYPGVFDLSLWDIGRKVCRPSNPACGECRLGDLCPSTSRVTASL